MLAHQLRYEQEIIYIYKEIYQQNLKLTSKILLALSVVRLSLFSQVANINTVNG